MLMVTAVKDKYDEMNTGVEIVGIFDSNDKAYAAEKKVLEWLEENGFDDGDVMICDIEVNDLVWYELN